MDFCRKVGVESETKTFMIALHMGVGLVVRPTSLSTFE